MNKRSGKGLIRGAFLRLMFNNIFIFVATCACGVIDNLFVGRILGQDALAAVGFFSPVMTAAGLSYVLIMGVQVLSGNYVGEGKTELVNKLFVSVFFVLLAVFTLFSTICILLKPFLPNFHLYATDYPRIIAFFAGDNRIIAELSWVSLYVEVLS